MAVEKRNNKWYIRGKVKLEDGTFKDYHRVAKGCFLKKDAEKYEEHFLKMYNEDLEQIHSRVITFKELIEIYLKNKLGTKKSSSLATDRYVFNLMDELYSKKINLIKTSTLRDFINKYNTEEYEISYVNKIRTYLNKLFNFAVKQNYISINPVKAISTFTRPDELKKEMSFFAPDEWTKFEKAYPKEDIVYYTIYCIMYYTGMRQGEVLALTLDDISNGNIRVNKTVSQYVNGTRYIVTPPKTKNSYRSVKIPAKLAGILNNYIEWYKGCSGVNGGTFLFGIDLPLLTKLVAKRFKRNCKKADIKEIRIHDLRHSHATLLINNGANVKAISDRLGNTVDEVLKTYAHLLNETENEMIVIIDKIFQC